MKLLSIACLASAFTLFSCGGGGGSSSGSSFTAPDLEGTWNVSATVVNETGTSTSPCGYATGEKYSDTFEITQSGASIEITDAASNVFTGVVNRNGIEWVGSYPFRTGTITVKQVTGSAAADRIEAMVNWGFISGTGGRLRSCGGNTRLSLTRASAPQPAKIAVLSVLQDDEQFVDQALSLYARPVSSPDWRELGELSFLGLRSFELPVGVWEIALESFDDAGQPVMATRSIDLLADEVGLVAASELLSSRDLLPLADGSRRP